MSHVVRLPEQRKRPTLTPLAPQPISFLDQRLDLRRVRSVSGCAGYDRRDRHGKHE
jgi:hypothetical protein